MADEALPFVVGPAGKVIDSNLGPTSLKTLNILPTADMPVTQKK